jgi:hypothetical protein
VIRVLVLMGVIVIRVIRAIRFPTAVIRVTRVLRSFGVVKGY